MSPLTGKVAMVTGGSRGIGASIATRLAEHGADVLITYRDDGDSAHRVMAAIEALGRRALAVRADSVEPEDILRAVQGAVDAFGGLDILVNNAGVFPYGPIDATSLDDIDRTLAVHARGAFIAAQAALAHMPIGGRIVSIGSCFVDRVPIGGVTLYAMSKAALTGFTKALARELGPRGITVNLVHPGPTDTDMNPADGAGAEAERSLTALGRYGEGDDIAATVAHLVGPGGRYITGASIAVDGGYAA